MRLCSESSVEILCRTLTIFSYIFYIYGGISLLVSFLLNFIYLYVLSCFLVSLFDYLMSKIFRENISNLTKKRMIIWIILLSIFIFSFAILSQSEKCYFPARNARIQGDLAQVNSIAELISDTDGTYVTLCISGSKNSLGKGNSDYNKQLSAIQEDIKSQDSTTTCYADTDSFCIYADLLGDSKNYYCIDSTGAIGITDSEPCISADDTCGLPITNSKKEIATAMIIDFMDSRMRTSGKGDLDNAKSYLTDNAKEDYSQIQFIDFALVGISNPHFSRYDILKIEELNSDKIKFIVRIYEELTDEGEVGYFEEILTVIPVGNEYFIDSVEKGDYVNIQDDGETVFSIDTWIHLQDKAPSPFIDKKISPEETVFRSLEWYFLYPNREKRYNENPYFSDDYKEKLRKIWEQEIVLADPVLFVQDLPSSFKIHKATITDDSAYLIITLDYGIYGYPQRKLFLVLINDRWQVNELIVLD